MAFIGLVFEPDAGAPKHRLVGLATPLSANHCCHQSSPGLIRCWSGMSAGSSGRPSRSSTGDMHCGLAIGVKLEANSLTHAQRLPSRRGRRGSRHRPRPSASRPISLLVVIRTARSGCSIWNAPSRHASQVLAKVWVVVTVSSVSSSCRWLAKALSIASNAPDQRRQQARAERGQPRAPLLAHEQRRAEPTPQGSSPDRKPPPGSFRARPRRP